MGAIQGSDFEPDWRGDLPELLGGSSQLCQVVSGNANDAGAEEVALPGDERIFSLLDSTYGSNTAPLWRTMIRAAITLRYLPVRE